MQAKLIFDLSEIENRQNRILDHFLISLLSFTLSSGVLAIFPFVTLVLFSSRHRRRSPLQELAINIFILFYENLSILIFISLLITIVVNYYYYFSICSEIKFITKVYEENNKLIYTLSDKYLTKNLNIEVCSFSNYIYKRKKPKFWQSEKRYHIYEIDKYVGYIDLDSPLWNGKHKIFYDYLNKYSTPYSS